MPIFKNHRGQFNGRNTALVALASLHVIGAAVALLSPYWAPSSHPVLAPLAAFSSTPVGICVLATVTVALISLAVYAIIKNNEVSQEKAPKVTKDGFLIRRDVYEEMNKNNQVKDENGSAKPGQSYLDFRLNSKDYRVIVGDQFTEEQGNTLLFRTYSLEMKGSDGKYARVTSKDQELEALGLKEDGDEINTYLGKLSCVTSSGQEQGRQ